MDLGISESALQGLRQLFGAITNDVSKKVVHNCVKQALTTNPNIPFKADLYSSCPDLIKQAEYSVLVCLFVATKKNASAEEMREYLTSKGVNKSTIDELATVYKFNREELQAKAMTFVPLTVPHITSVNWSLVCDIDSTGLSRPGELSYKIQLTGNDVSDEQLSFLCSPEELQAFINRLKEIERHCNRTASTSSRFIVTQRGQS